MQTQNTTKFPFLVHYLISLVLLYCAQPTLTATTKRIDKIEVINQDAAILHFRVTYNDKQTSKTFLLPTTKKDPFTEWYKNERNKLYAFTLFSPPNECFRIRPSSVLKDFDLKDTRYHYTNKKVGLRQEDNNLLLDLSELLTINDKGEETEVELDTWFQENVSFYDEQDKLIIYDETLDMLGIKDFNACTPIETITSSVPLLHIGVYYQNLLPKTFLLPTGAYPLLEQWYNLQETKPCHFTFFKPCVVGTQEKKGNKASEKITNISACATFFSEKAYHHQGESVPLSQEGTVLLFEKLFTLYNKGYERPIEIDSWFRKNSITFNNNGVVLNYDEENTDDEDEKKEELPLNSTTKGGSSARNNHRQVLALIGSIIIGTILYCKFFKQNSPPASPTSTAKPPPTPSLPFPSTPSAKYSTSLTSPSMALINFHGAIRRYLQSKNSTRYAQKSRLPS